jgi:hypothetical protein
LSSGCAPVDADAVKTTLDRDLTLKKSARINELSAIARVEVKDPAISGGLTARNVRSWWDERRTRPAAAHEYPLLISRGRHLGR